MHGNELPYNPRPPEERVPWNAYKRVFTKHGPFDDHILSEARVRDLLRRPHLERSEPQRLEFEDTIVEELGRYYHSRAELIKQGKE